MARFDEVGGTAFFEDLTSRFYAKVAGDELLRPMYPDDLAPPEAHLACYLAQHLGGPRRYEETRGAPKLRLRHLRFRIDEEVAARWLELMDASLAETGLDDALAASLLEELTRVARMLVNAGGLSIR